MITKQRLVAISLVAVSFLMGSLAISCCGLGQLFGPTITPTPTQTQTPTPTPTPTLTPTPDPVAKAIEDANQLWLSGNSEEAISRYKSILQQSTEPSIRKTVFGALEKIGVQIVPEAYFKDTGYPDQAECNIFQQALSAYEPILNAQDRPTFEQDPFYIDAAKVEVKLIYCHLWQEDPEKTYTEVINSLLDDLALFPDKPAITDIFVPAILSTFEDEVTRVYIEKYPEVLHNDGQMINTKVGEYQVNGKKVSEWVDATLLKYDFCSGNPVLSTTVGTSSTKKVFSCDSSLTTALEQAGLYADVTDPSEIWFVVDYEYVESGNIQCTGYRTDTGTTFSYTYPGQSKEVYVLKNAHNGKVVASKTFWSTVPRCVFFSCTLNTFTNTATCNGGEGYSTYDEAVLIQWLKGIVK
jgi:hypothetical protein